MTPRCPRGRLRRDPATRAADTVRERGVGGDLRRDLRRSDPDRIRRVTGGFAFVPTGARRPAAAPPRDPGRLRGPRPRDDPAHPPVGLRPGGVPAALRKFRYPRGAVRQKSGTFDAPAETAAGAGDPTSATVCNARAAQPGGARNEPCQGAVVVGYCGGGPRAARRGGSRATAKVPVPVGVSSCSPDL